MAMTETLEKITPFLRGNFAGFGKVLFQKSPVRAVFKTNVVPLMLGVLRRVRQDPDDRALIPALGVMAEADQIHPVSTRQIGNVFRFLHAPPLAFLLPKRQST